MSATLTFPVPMTSTSRFVVAGRTIPKNLPALAITHATDAYRSHITGRLGTPQLALAREPAGLRWDPRRLKAVHPRHRAAEATLHRACEFAVVTAFGPITDQPRGVQVARAAAYSLARAIDGVAADLVTGHIFYTADTEGLSTERARFVLADQWLADALPPVRSNGRCTAADPDQDPEGVNGCSCVRLLTSGLRRFGLPELAISDVACPHDVAALNVLRTTARRLLSDHWSWLATGPATRTRAMDANLTLSATDFDGFWGSTRRDHSPAPSSFQVRLTSITPRLLAITPPNDFHGTVNDWLWSGTLPPGMYDLLSSPADEDLHPLAHQPTPAP
ncbi:hypothetical protein [Actinomadura yumaensis]|uniref:Uncharacterized protein n=1 Tax=Actinomadura yumaensis TaxID=111807 RepID=A0ABW2CNX6_9ACTN